MTTTQYRPAVLAAGEFLSPAQVTELLPGLTENALAIQRHRHLAPVFCRFGRTIVYPADGIQAWISASTVPVRPNGR